MSRRSVVLPAPLGPKRPVKAPCASVRDAPSTAATPPKRTRKSSRASSGAVIDPFPVSAQPAPDLPCQSGQPPRAEPHGQQQQPAEQKQLLIAHEAKHLRHQAQQDGRDDDPPGRAATIGSPSGRPSASPYG